MNIWLKRMQLPVGIAGMILTAAPPCAAQTATVVTPDNFARAETDTYFASIVGQAGLGRFRHHRELMPIERQTVVRPNRDTIYSSAVFDLDAGPVTITLPESGKRFLSLQVIDEDHYVPAVVYGGGSFTFTREQIGTRYMLAGVRILVDPTEPGDSAKVRKLQDAITVSQPGGPGSFDVPAWDPATRKQVRDALSELGATLPDYRRAFGRRGDVDPVRHLIGAATVWGANPDRDAIYLNATPSRNDGQTVHQLAVGSVPADGFWSISVYNAQGYFDPSQTTYTLNGFTAKKGQDGLVRVQFGGCGEGVANCLSIVPGWNYMVRLYRPRPEVLDGSWSFPQARPAE